VTADALILAVGVSLTGLLRPPLAARLNTGVPVCEVLGRNVGLVFGVVVPLAALANEGEGKGGGAGDRARDPVEVVDRREAELGVFLKVGLLLLPPAVDPVEL
jgi:hypothetical protein